MTKSEFIELYKKNECKQKPFRIMVRQGNGVWADSVVVGMSISGYPILSGWFVSGCFDTTEYMTIDGYNAIHGEENGIVAKRDLSSNQYF